MRRIDRSTIAVYGRVTHTADDVLVLSATGALAPSSVYVKSMELNAESFSWVRTPGEFDSWRAATTRHRVPYSTFMQIDVADVRFNSNDGLSNTSALL